MGWFLKLVTRIQGIRGLSSGMLTTEHILRLRRGIAFPAKTVAAIDSEPIFAMNLFFNFMRNGSEVKKL